MNYHKCKYQGILERLVMIIVVVLLGYLIVRAYILSGWDWNKMRGPLAPREYYQLGLLDEPIPSKEYLSYIKMSPSASTILGATSTYSINSELSENLSKDPGLVIENGTEERR